MVTLVITIPLLIVQLRAAGISAALLIGMSSTATQVLCTVLMGCRVACFAGVTDLRGTTFVPGRQGTDLPDQKLGFRRSPQGRSAAGIAQASRGTRPRKAS
ncbi:hypothetical protein [Streptomyces sp. 900105245]|uniref:Uncharacterized protein n=1 Tax=Streptomyces sp. 900105245 TaxID=3154379 RepID=A0ABV1TZA6_9ACTN